MNPGRIPAHAISDLAMPDGGRLAKPLPAAKRMGRPWPRGWGLFALSLLHRKTGQFGFNCGMGMMTPGSKPSS